jgi:chromosome segregation ATPase
LSALSEHIENIQVKLQQLLRQYELLQKENSKQLEMISVLESEQIAYREKLAALQQQNLVLKASVTDMDATDKKVLEQKIQHYIKNIDKCISLLSQ